VDRHRPPGAGLLYNPDAQPELDIRPLLTERLCLVSRLQDGGHGPVPLRTLGDYPLILPERLHVIRRQLDTQATLAGLKLRVVWEVSSVASILDLVGAGLGHAVLTDSAVAISGRADTLVARPLVDPGLPSVLCLATSARHRPSPLVRQASHLLQELVHALPQGMAAGSRPG